ncbi:T9SS type A sorting domain-containing protein [Flammeovirga sp. SubArs3]|uniref:T9SS type A sorting domain-containing protein n=1 Tax=Flammeovirga sp. SubArs3 TaxID=2995316 RepID=UPI00248C0492|nr:T9SS type A sorting domain-containing protein [Flammeovirga sp. SubArs3]
MAILTASCFNSFAAEILLSSSITDDYTIKSNDYGIHKSSGDVTIDNSDGNNHTFSVRLDYKYDSDDESNSDYVVVAGDLIIEANTELSIEQGVLFIVEGDVIVHGDASFKNQGYFVVMGSVTGTGNINTGNGFDATPAYIGGSIGSGITVTGDGTRDTPLNIVEPDIRSILNYEVTGWEADLPVELISFTANLDKENVTLEWATASEVNASHFEVMKSINKVDWVSIGEVEAAGNSSTTQYYSFTDTDIVNNSMYYKLVQVDFDGQTETFGPLSVYPEGLLFNMTATIYPNPAVSDINLMVSGLNEGNDLNIWVIDKMGKVIFQDSNSIEASSFIYKLDQKLSHITPGNYIVTLQSGNNKISTRFIKN